MLLEHLGPGAHSTSRQVGTQQMCSWGWGSERGPVQVVRAAHQLSNEHPRHLLIRSANSYEPRESMALGYLVITN